MKRNERFSPAEETGLNRRRVLNGGSALALAISCSAATAIPSLASGERQVLTAQPGSVKLMGSQGGTADLWTFDGVNPGPVLRCKRGERLAVDVVNHLDTGTSVHWHGIRIDNAMDGVSGLTQAPIDPGGTFAYDFVTPDAGTYWYHSHNRSWEQVARGLYGALIVEEGEPYPVDRDIVFVLDDWRLTRDGALHEESLGNHQDWSHGGRLGNWVTVNGMSQPRMSVRAGDRLRVRLINAATARVLALLFPSRDATVIALDGQPLEKPVPFPAGDTITLAPAQRADIILDAYDAIALSALAGDQAVDVAFLDIEGENSTGFSDWPVEALPPNNLPFPNLNSTIAVPLVMRGGAMRWLENATYQNEVLGGRALADRGIFWSFNDVAGKPREPLFSSPVGQTVVVEMVNETMWPHGIHLHGHHFREVSENDDGSSLGPWRDTILLERGERKRIALVTDNPGKWMLHCHMLEHQVAGMATWFEVV